MKIILCIFILLFLAVACDRTFESGSLGFNAPSEPPVPIGLKISRLIDGIKLDWQVTNASVVDYFNIYYTNNAEGDYVLLDTTSNLTMTLTTLSAGQEYFFRVATVSTEGAESSPSLVVSTFAGITSTSINNDAIYTNSVQVSLRFVLPSEALAVKLSEDPLLNGAEWRSFSQPSSFTLTGGDGVKHIYATLRFADGTESADAITDSIILDTRATIDSVWFSADSTPLLAGDTVVFFVDAGETNGAATISFPGVSNMDLYDDASVGDISANDGIYSRYYVVPVGSEVEEGLVTADFTDAAGNDADAVVAPELINIVIPIESINLWAIAESSSSIRLDWTEVSADDFISYRIYRDETAGVDETSELAEIITSRTSISYTDLTLDDNQGYYYRIYAYGSQGLLTSSAEVMVTTPAIEGITLWATAESSLSIRLDWTEIDSGDFVSYRIYRDVVSGVDESSDLAAVILSQSTVTIMDDDLDASQPYYYKIYAYGSQGLLTSSPETMATTASNTDPDPVVLALDLGDQDGLAIVLTWTQNEDDDFESYQIYRGDGSSVSDITGDLIAVINNQSQTTYTNYRGAVTDKYYYVIYVYDQQGGRSSDSNVVETP